MNFFFVCYLRESFSDAIYCTIYYYIYYCGAETLMAHTIIETNDRRTHKIFPFFGHHVKQKP